VGLFADYVPEDYLKSIDIKNPIVKFFPSFGGKASDRMELRFMNAADDEYILALQIRWVRSLLDTALNGGQEAIKKLPNFTPGSLELWKANPERFVQDANAHLKALGLNPKEYQPIVRNSLIDQQYVPMEKPEPRRAQMGRIRLEEEEDSIPTELIAGRLASHVEGIARNRKELVKTYQDADRAVNGPNMQAILESFDAGLERVNELLSSRRQYVELMSQRDRKALVEFLEQLREGRKLITRSIPELSKLQQKELTVQLRAFESRRSLLDSYIDRVKRIIAKSGAPEAP
jgi:hypothetical protein